MEKERLYVSDVVNEWHRCEGNIEDFVNSLFTGYNLTEKERAIIMVSYYLAEHAKQSR